MVYGMRYLSASDCGITGMVCHLVGETVFRIIVFGSRSIDFPLFMDS